MAHRFNAHVLGEGVRTVVFGHGFGTDQTSWDAQVRSLVEQGYRVVLFDFAGATPGTLAAYQPARHASLYGFAEDLVLLLRELGVSKASYVGHSLGAAIGILACHGEPGLFDSLQLLAASARYIDDPAQHYVGGFSPQEVDSLLDTMHGDYVAWANGFGPLAAGRHEKPTLAIDFTRRLLSLRPDVACAVFAAAMRSDLRAEVEAIRVPLQVLQTESDVAVPLAAANWLAEHGRARDFRVIATRGHFPQLAAPRAINAALLDFLHVHTHC
ncbi:alpha/beta fold hydrolase [Paludibacterium yongneupense]|uniref:alpha/beta fold hydrolase n=1 Tax=Paludibacterium yongneupense TaxID=400061 RepID=UPI000404AD37|nr:alpha/beta hydrolase [Paludibacterium yongneupense]